MMVAVVVCTLALTCAGLLVCVCCVLSVSVLSRYQFEQLFN